MSGNRFCISRKFAGNKELVGKVEPAGKGVFAKKKYTAEGFPGPILLWCNGLLLLIIMIMMSCYANLYELKLFRDCIPVLDTSIEISSHVTLKIL